MIGKTVFIGGKDRPVNFGRNAFREYEKITGHSLLTSTESIVTFEGIQTLIYVGCKWGLYNDNGIEPKPDFTLINVGDWMDKENNDSQAYKTIFELFTDAMPGGKKKEDENSNQ